MKIDMHPEMKKKKCWMDFSIQTSIPGPVSWNLPSLKSPIYWYKLLKCLCLIGCWLVCLWFMHCFVDNMFHETGGLCWAKVPRGLFHETCQQWKAPSIDTSYWNAHFWLAAGTFVSDSCTVLLITGFMKQGVFVRQRYLGACFTKSAITEKPHLLIQATEMLASNWLLIWVGLI